MTSMQVKYSDKILRQKMNKWLKLKDVGYSSIFFMDSDLDIDISRARTLRWLLGTSYTPPETFHVREEIIELKKRIRKLEKSVGEERKPTKVDYVYELHKEGLERQYFGKVVAIDTDLDKIVGIGDTVLEAYEKARAKTGKEQFDFRRVGYDYIEKV